MPSQIRVTCPGCGDVELPIGAMELEVGVGVALADPLAVGRYRFQCSSCDELVHCEAQRYVVQLLLASGVRLLDRSVIQPSRRPEQVQDAPLDDDDLDRVRALLDRPFTVATFVGSA